MKMQTTFYLKNDLYCSIFDSFSYDFQATFEDQDTQYVKSKKIRMSKRFKEKDGSHVLEDQDHVTLLCYCIRGEKSKKEKSKQLFLH